MKGLKISFTDAGADIQLNQSTEKHGLKVQNALVNLGTSAGSDRTFPTRGTRIAKVALSAGFRDLVTAQHELNFATSDTLFFERENEPETEEWSLEVINATPSLLSGRFVQANLSFQHLDGKVTGTSSPIAALEPL